jgi:hypothetical protein
MDQKPSDKQETDERIWQPTERDIQNTIYWMWGMMIVVIAVGELTMPWSWTFMVPMGILVGVRAQRLMRNPDPDEDD